MAVRWYFKVRLDVCRKDTGAVYTAWEDHVDEAADDGRVCLKRFALCRCCFFDSVNDGLVEILDKIIVIVALIVVVRRLA